MNRAIKNVLIILAVLAAATVAVALAYRHFILDDIRDGGNGMTNPNLDATLIQPAEGARLVYCDVTRRGEMANDQYSYTLEQDGNEVLLYADYITDDNEHITIDGEAVDPALLTELNTLVLSMSLYETEAPEQGGPEPPLDADKKTYTLRWDDGTTGTPDGGFDVVQAYFTTNVLN